MARVVITRNGNKSYYNDNGKRHREDGPAWITKNGHKWWYLNGILDNNGGPTTWSATGICGWNTLDDKPRIDGPSWNYPNGLKRWFDEDGIIWPKL